jgi:hypothetical protein
MIITDTELTANAQAMLEIPGLELLMVDSGGS